jgi:uncharacterized Zn-finger protein
MNKIKEVVKTKNHKVSCSGNDGALGHPLVYLEFGPDKTKLACPYCSKKFSLTK